MIFLYLVKLAHYLDLNRLSGPRFMHVKKIIPNDFLKRSNYSLDLRRVAKRAYARIVKTYHVIKRTTGNYPINREYKSSKYKNPCYFYKI